MYYYSKPDAGVKRKKKNKILFRRIGITGKATRPPPAHLQFGGSNNQLLSNSLSLSLHYLFIGSYFCFLYFYFYF